MHCICMISRPRKKPARKFIGGVGEVDCFHPTTLASPLPTPNK